MQSFQIIAATPVLALAVKSLITAQMASYLSKLPNDVLRDEEACASLLLGQGFSTQTIAELLDAARRKALVRIVKAGIAASFILFVLLPFLPDGIAPTAVHAFEEAIEAPLEAIGLLADDFGQ